MTLNLWASWAVLITNSSLTLLMLGVTNRSKLLCHGEKLSQLSLAWHRIRTYCVCVFKVARGSINALITLNDWMILYLEKSIHLLHMRRSRFCYARLDTMSPRTPHIKASERTKALVKPGDQATWEGPTWEWLLEVSIFSWDLSLASFAASFTSRNFSANCKKKKRKKKKKKKEKKKNAH